MQWQPRSGVTQAVSHRVEQSHDPLRRGPVVGGCAAPFLALLRCVEGSHTCSYRGSRMPAQGTSDDPSGRRTRSIKRPTARVRQV
jgi:hypothetical protein